MEGNEGEYARRSVYTCRTTVRPPATAAPVFVVNGLKREELVAANSMILHELFFASLGAESEAEGELRDALAPRFRQCRSLAC
jgi:Fe-Mn family superoxide dismutase